MAVPSPRSSVFGPEGRLRSGPILAFSARVSFRATGNPADASKSRLSRPDGHTGLNGGGTYLGSVVYGHCNASFTGPQNTAEFGEIRALTEIAYVAAGNIEDCYEGAHVHMEAIGASGANTSMSCSSASWLYYF
ncbi:MAG: hypothetical protein IPI33_06620 [Dehalococcoidia bacterium]|nr:hypothetical protein [Dehalococcoidia bacterium]